MTRRRNFMKIKMLGAAALALLSAVLISCSHTGKEPSQTETESGGKEREPSMTIVITDAKYGAVSDGTVDCTGAFAGAVSDAGGKECTVFVPAGTYRVDGSVRFPENITLKFGKGAVITAAKGAEITLDCAVDAQMVTIFDGEGSFSGNSPSVCYPEWFGAAADGTDSSAALQKSVDIFREVHLNAGNGSYKLGGVRITKPLTLTGTGSLRVGITAKKGMNLFEIASGGVSVSNLYVTGNSGNADKAVFYLDTEAADISGVKIANVHGTQNGYFVKDAGLGRHKVTDFEMESCTVNLNQNTTVYVQDFADGIRFVDIIADNVPNASEVNYPGWYMENITGMFMDNVDAAGGLGKGNGGDGFVFVNCSNVRIERGMQDYVNGVGLKLIGCTKMDFSNFVCSLYEKQGIYMENVTDSTFEMIKANGIYPTIKVAETRGEVYEAMTLKNCTGLTFNNLTVQFNQSHGLVVEDCTDITVNSYVFWSNNGDAYIERGGSDRNILNGAVCCSNYKSDARFVQVGKNSVMRGLVIKFSYREPVTGAAEIS